MKIYNEIIIDMNPESPTFEETIYEDNFEYNDEIILMQSGSDTDWGAENITTDMFITFDANGNPVPRELWKIYKDLDPILTGITGSELEAQIRDMLPKFMAAAKEEKGFLKTEKGFAEEEAGLTREADIYGIQKEAQAKAGEAGAQMRGVYGGMGGAMRGAIGAKADIGKAYTKGIGATEDAYSLSMRKAKHDYTKGIYGLDETAKDKMESGIGDWITNIGEDAFVDAGEDAVVDPGYFTGESLYDDEGYTEEARANKDDYIDQRTRYKEGGRVPKREETFLDFLTQLPDAGGN